MRLPLGVAEVLRYGRRALRLVFQYRGMVWTAFRHGGLHRAYRGE